jgi:predicted glycosyltransferase
MRWQEAATLLPHLTPAERALFFVGGGGQSSESLAMLPLNATKQKPEINPFKIL